jgi:spoIIIJ-associated protein
MEKENNDIIEEDKGPEGSEENEFKGRNLEEAISLAEHRLKTEREELNYEIVTEKTRLFGIKSKEIVIRAWPKRSGESRKVEDFLDALKKLFPLDLDYQLKKKGDMIFLVFDGPDKSMLVKDDGALLLSLQHILNKVSPVKVQADCEFFRSRKEKQLREYARRAAEQAAASGRDEILEPMNPYERRLVHIAVEQVRGMTSESLGDGFMKKVKVFRAKK